MPLVLCHRVKEVVIGVWHIEETEETLLAELNFKSYQKQILAFSSPKRRLQWLAGRRLVYELEPALLGKRLEVFVGPEGAPYLSNGRKVSLSHSGKYAAVLLTEKQSGGVDIQCMSEKAERVSSRFLMPGEISDVPIAYSVYYFNICWSAKEAVYKLLQRKGVSFKHQLKITSFIPGEEGTLRVNYLKMNGGVRPVKADRIYEVNYQMIDGYVLAWVCDDFR